MPRCHCTVLLQALCAIEGVSVRLTVNLSKSVPSCSVLHDQRLSVCWGEVRQERVGRVGCIWIVTFQSNMAGDQGTSSWHWLGSRVVIHWLFMPVMLHCFFSPRLPSKSDQRPLVAALWQRFTGKPGCMRYTTFNVDPSPPPNFCVYKFVNLSHVNLCKTPALDH